MLIFEYSHETRDFNFTEKRKVLFLIGSLYLKHSQSNVVRTQMNLVLVQHLSILFANSVTCNAHLAEVV